MNARECGACGKTKLPCEIHHVRKLIDMLNALLGWLAKAARLRKRVVLCRATHTGAGSPAIRRFLYVLSSAAHKFVISVCGILNYSRQRRKLRT